MKSDQQVGVASGVSALCDIIQIQQQKIQFQTTYLGQF